MEMEEDLKVMDLLIQEVVVVVVAWDYCLYSCCYWLEKILYLSSHWMEVEEL